FLNFQCWLTGFGEETRSLEADEIAEVEQSKKIDQFGANFLRVNVNLNAPSRVAKIEKVALAHVAMRGDAAGGTKCVALFEFRPNLRDVAAGLESCAKRFDTSRAKLIQFFAPKRDQLILFLHLRRANVNRRGENEQPEYCSRWPRQTRRARDSLTCVASPSLLRAKALRRREGNGDNIGLQRKDRR